MKSIRFSSLMVLILLGIIGCGENGAQRSDVQQSDVNHEVSRPLIKTTKSGHKFRQVTVEELVEKHKMTKVNATKFVGTGAFEDESGMVWGDTAISEDTNLPKHMNHEDAQKYCESIGAELPSGYPENQNGKNGFLNQDSDFVRLSKYMGATANSNEDYSAQILPNLTYLDPKDKNIYGSCFWSSSVLRDFSRFAFFFSGRGGSVDYYNRSFGYSTSVRCIVRQR